MLGSSQQTLPEILEQHGYRTGGVIANSLLSVAYGFAQGFDAWDESQVRGHAAVTTPGVTRQAERILRQLSAGGHPFFPFVNYYDPHYAYRPHRWVGFAPYRAGRLRGGETIERLHDLGPSMTPEETGFLRAVYDEEIRITDAGIGELLETLRELGIEQDTVVVLTADHGEEFLEHGWLGHTRFLYEAVIRVPLLIRPAPPPDAGRVVEAPVSLLALAPTLLELVGIEPAGYGYAADSFAASVRGRSSPTTSEALLSQVDFEPQAVDDQSKRSRQQAIVTDRFKSIRDEISGGIELFDLSTDRAERTNLASAQGG